MPDQGLADQAPAPVGSTGDAGRAQRGMEQNEVNARWQAEMAPFFDLPEGARPDTGGERLEEIFHLD